MKCPLCESRSHRVFERYDIWIADCEACGHRFADIEPTSEDIRNVYGDDYFEGGGAGYKNYLDEERLLRASGRRYAGIVGKYASPGTVLDIGAAAGFILQGFQDAGWTGSGIEVNENMSAYGREKLKLDIFTGDLEAYSHAAYFDLVTMIQVIPHLRDPLSALGKVAGLTKTAICA